MAVPYYAVQALPDTNARQPTMTIRPSSTALLTIDSEDRYTDMSQSRASISTPYNFAISKNESLMPGFITRIGVSEINFPWLVPNVNSKTNTISVRYVTTSTSGDAVLVLPIGFYAPGDLAAAIQQGVRAIPGGPASFAMTYGANNLPVFTYLCTGADRISFSPFPSNSPSYPYPPQTKQLFDVLGFTDTNSGVPSIGGVGIFTLCQSIRYIDIVCNQLTNSQAQKDQTSQTIARDMLCRIYLGDGGGTGQSTVLPSDPNFSPPGCAPTTIYRNFANPKQIQWIPNQNIPGFLAFAVFDDTGALLDDSFTALGYGEIYTGTNWSMTMLVSEC